MAFPIKKESMLNGLITDKTCQVIQQIGYKSMWEQIKEPLYNLLQICSLLNIVLFLLSI